MLSVAVLAGLVLLVFGLNPAAEGNKADFQLRDLETRDELESFLKSSDVHVVLFHHGKKGRHRVTTILYVDLLLCFEL